MADLGCQPTEPLKLTLDVASGALRGSNDRYEKHLSELEGVYRDDRAFADALPAWQERPVYWVESSRTQEGPGGLITGLSVLQAGRVGDEFFMTRGHLHAKADCAETYLGLRGHGVMLLDSLDGESRAIGIREGEAVYVPGGWVHRSVNVGREPFITLFCYPVEAGQDYELIAQAGGMRDLVVATPSGWATRPNPDHRGYAPSTVPNSSPDTLS